MVDKGVRGFDPARLRAIRERRRDAAPSAGTWTQEDVARRLGVLRVNYLAWEQGRRTPSPATLVRLASLLEVEPHELTEVDPADATLADLRQWAGLTQSDVARQLGVSRSTYAAVERGERPLAQAHAVSLTRLLRGDQEILAPDTVVNDEHGNV